MIMHRKQRTKDPYCTKGKKSQKEEQNLLTHRQETKS